jgi:beta-fructofuranosidase
VYFDPSAELVVVDRSTSTCIPGVATFNESAPHTLFSFANSAGDGTGKVALSREELSFHVYFDHGVVEAFVNKRTVVTTRVYPSTATCQMIQPFISPNNAPAADDGFQSQLLDLEFWPLEL